MPKLLFVGIVERTCCATIIREIPGITECFQAKDDSKKGGEPEIKVHLDGCLLNCLFILFAAYNEWVEFPWPVAICGGIWGEYTRR